MYMMLYSNIVLIYRLLDFKFSGMACTVIVADFISHFHYKYLMIMTFIPHEGRNTV